MPYRLTLEDPVADVVRRVATEELELAVRGLEDPASDPVRAVHEARKAVKKVRGLLRLVEPGVPRKRLRAIQRELRDAARLMAGARDADVMVAVVDALADEAVGRVPGSVLDELRARLEERRVPFEGHGGAVAALRAVAAGVPSWPLDGVGRSTVLDGAALTYERGVAELAVAREAGTAEALHDWRKRVKDLWYHQRLLAGVWPAVLEAQAAETKRLSELLGDDHDAAVLAELLRGDADLAADPRADVEAVVPLLQARRSRLQAEALELGRLVYAERPKAVRRRLAAWMA